MLKPLTVSLIIFTLSLNIFASQSEMVISNNTDLFIKKVNSSYNQNRGLVTLTKPDGELISLKVDYYSYVDDYLSVGGSDTNDSNSIFFIKGNTKKIYGYIHYKKTGLVYKYFSNSKGEVVVKEVPLSDVIKVDDMEYPEESYVPYIESNSRQEMPDIPQLCSMPQNVNFLTLESKPSSNKVMWLNINELVNNGESIYYTPEDLYLVWQIVAAGFAAFDVNVTTNENVYNSTAEQNRGYGILYNEDGRSKCSYNGFGTSYGYCTIYRKSSGYFGGRTAFHEFGHLVGMADQGMGWDKYFPGFAQYKWVPIMGNFLKGDNWEEETLYQWSRGEYPNSSRHDEIYDTMVQYFDKVPDDIPGTKALVFSGDNILIKDNYGMINPPLNNLDDYDEDDFTFIVSESGADVNLTIDRIGHIGSAMLDVHASILDDGGNIIIEDNPDCARYAQLQTQLEPGSYTLRVAGGLEGNPPTEGFTRYGSIGYYGISGYITGASVDNVKLDVSHGIRGIRALDGVITLAGIKKDEQATFTVFQASGRKIFEKKSLGNKTYDLKTMLGKGFYILKLKTKKVDMKSSVVIF